MEVNDIIGIFQLKGVFFSNQIIAELEEIDRDFFVRKDFFICMRSGN
jgi:hypothetical protein